MAITSPRTANKRHHSQSALQAVGGTPNHARHLYGGYDGRDTNQSFAVVTYREVKSYVPNTTSYGYDNRSTDTVPGNRRSDSTMQERPALNRAMLERRAERKGMTVEEYCEWCDLPYSEYVR